MKYFVARDGQSYGPYTLADLQAMSAQGNLGAAEMVWSEGLNEWVAAERVLGNMAAPPPMVAAPSQGGWGAPPAAPPVARVSGPMPPGLHWGLLLLLTVVTCGFMSLIWMFVESVFVKKIDRGSNATLYYGLYLAGYFVGVVVAAVMAAADADAAAAAGLLGGLIQIGSVGFFIAGTFSMKNSLEEYYTHVEPMGLQLSGVMTFFFNVLYFQYHFSAIAEWKRGQAGGLR